MTNHSVALLHEMAELGSELGIDLFVQRDDLLPFPLAGNKVRKLNAEFAQIPERCDSLVTHGSVDSNHCRTVALMAAHRGLSVHLVLHGDAGFIPPGSKALEMLTLLGATFEIVAPSGIGGSIERAVWRFRSSGFEPHTIAGGCHTPAGSISYRDAGVFAFNETQPDFVFVASGTGATQGGLMAAAQQLAHSPDVVGISVARNAARGVAPITEAARWAGCSGGELHFDDGYLAGGYGLADERVWEAVRTGWRHGLPLDPTYTGKAFAGLLDYARSGRLKGSRVLFWHTGGLWNFLARPAEVLGPELRPGASLGPGR